MKTKQEEFKEIVMNAREPMQMIHMGELPNIGEYLVTGLQMGNHQGQLGWHKYIGYVVQIRKGVGAFNSDMILLRHPDGVLTRHENQFYYRMSEHWEKKAKALFNKGINPSMEDYTQPYTLSNGQYPAIGKIIEANVNHPIPDNSPLMQITTVSNGKTTVEII